MSTPSSGGKVPMWSLGVFFALRYSAGYLLAKPLDTTTTTTPIVAVTESFLDKTAFRRLRAAIVDEPGGLAWSKWSVANQLNEKFNTSRGFVLRFNRDGAADAFAGEFAPLRPFFESVTTADDNAFVLNLLHVAKGCESKEQFSFETLAEEEEEQKEEKKSYSVPWEGCRVSAGGVTRRGFARWGAHYSKQQLKQVPAHSNAQVALHVDETVGIDSNRLFLAHAVSVLYVGVAANADGGHLELFEPNRVVAARTADAAADAVVTPEPNRLAVFRGNAYHRVSSYCGDAPRISLVLEAYRISPAYYGSTTRFEILRQQKDHRRYGGLSVSTAVAGLLKFDVSTGIAAQILRGVLLSATAFALIFATIQFFGARRRLKKGENEAAAEGAASQPAVTTPPEKPTNSKKSSRKTKSTKVH